MTTATIKAAADSLDTIIRIESCIVEMELHFSRRHAPFTPEEKALLDKLDAILRKAKESYLTT